MLADLYGKSRDSKPHRDATDCGDQESYRCVPDPDGAADGRDGQPKAMAVASLTSDSPSRIVTIRRGACPASDGRGRHGVGKRTTAQVHRNRERYRQDGAR